VSPELRLGLGIATGIVWGIVFGLIPALLGRRWGRPKDGVRAFWICFVGGLLFGVYLAGPLMIATTVWLWRRRAPAVAPGSGKAQELFR